MIAIRSQYSRLLQQSIAARRHETLEALAIGQNKKNYWRLVGVIQGLDDAMKVTEEVDYNMSGDEPDAGG